MFRIPHSAIIIILFSAILISGSCAPRPDFDSSLNATVKPYTFSIARWEFEVLADGLSKPPTADKSDDDGRAVEQFFSTIESVETIRLKIEAIKTGRMAGELAPLEAELIRFNEKEIALKHRAEQILKNQIKEVLAEQGILNPLDKYISLRINFPPVEFKLAQPPHLLVISPRSRVESLREILLKQDLVLEEMESIEGEADKLDVSSLVVGLGGLGTTYPTFVNSKASLRNAIDAVIEEWLHQYLAFRPLGFRYVLDLLGIWRDYEIATMNETVAGMVSKEIGAAVFDKYYAESQKTPTLPANEFDFNREMREIRKTVDQYLANGEIETAERFMEERRQYLASQGYHIRKLNQAYFAFYGAYADSLTSVNPIGAELKQLREKSATLKDFFDTASSISSRVDLQRSLTPGDEAPESR